MTISTQTAARPPTLPLAPVEGGAGRGAPADPSTVDLFNRQLEGKPKPAAGGSGASSTAAEEAYLRNKNAKVFAESGSPDSRIKVAKPSGLVAAATNAGKLSMIEGGTEAKERFVKIQLQKAEEQGDKTKMELWSEPDKTDEAMYQALNVRNSGGSEESLANAKFLRDAGYSDDQIRKMGESESAGAVDDLIEADVRKDAAEADTYLEKNPEAQVKEVTVRDEDGSERTQYAIVNAKADTPKEQRELDERNEGMAVVSDDLKYRPGLGTSLANQTGHQLNHVTSRSHFEVDTTSQTAQASRDALKSDKETRGRPVPAADRATVQPDVETQDAAQQAATRSDAAKGAARSGANRPSDPVAATAPLGLASAGS